MEEKLENYPQMFSVWPLLKILTEKISKTFMGGTSITTVGPKLRPFFARLPRRLAPGGRGGLEAQNREWQ